MPWKKVKICEQDWLKPNKTAICYIKKAELAENQQNCYEFM